MNENRILTKDARTARALDRTDDDLGSGVPIESKYTTRTVRLIPKPSLYPPARVRAVRGLIGACQEVFAQWSAVSPMTVRSWEQGLRRPSPIARRFLDEIEMSPGHFRGRIPVVVVDAGPSHRIRGSGSHAKNDPRRGH